MRTETEHGPLEYETEKCSLCGLGATPSAAASLAL